MSKIQRDTHTQRKLKEAEFFFEKLRESYSTIPDFDYYLSAFVSAARAVTFVMVWEYDKAPGFKEWNRVNDWTPEEKVFMAAIHDLRTETHKRRLPVTPFDVVIDDEAFTPETWAGFKDKLARVKAGGIPVRLTRLEDGFLWEAEIDGTLYQFKGTLPASGRRLPNLPDHDAVEVCRKFLEAVREVVDECTRRFLPADDSAKS